MNTLFKHIILTRFNYVVEEDYNVSYDYVNSDDYLSERFRLFEFFCFPSVSNQENSNFTWLVLFNDRLPEKWRKKLEDYRQKCPNFEPCYISAKQTIDLEKFWNDLIIQKLTTAKEYPQYLLTSRIDNDDAIHLSFVDSMQQYFFEHKEEAIVNYINGLQYNPEYNVLKSYRSVKGHFTTRIEKYSPQVETVMAFSHDRPPESLKFVALRNKNPMWIEVIHQVNIANAPVFQIEFLFGDLFFIGSKYKNLDNFGIKQPISRYNFNIWRLYFRRFCKKIKKIKNKCIA